MVRLARIRADDPGRWRKMDRQSVDFPAGLQSNQTPGAQISNVAALTWRLSIPAGPAGRYRLAQLDDYSGLSRRSFRWQAGFYISLEARASHPNIPGTWGFGVWNDPFSMGLLNRAGEGRKTTSLRLPALPDTAWFFYASPPSYLSVRDDLPAQGWLAATFRASSVPPAVLATAILGIPLLLFPPVVRIIRRALRKFVTQDAALLVLDPSEGHRYDLTWEREAVIFQVDGQNVLKTSVVPKSNLGLVIWLDNQYMALSPGGRIGYGMHANPEPAWIEVRNIEHQS